MKRSTLLVLAVLIASTARVQAQSLLQASIVTPEKAVAVVNQTLDGTWLSELRPPGLPSAAPSIPQIVTFNPNGTVFASSADGTTSLAHGLWVRVGDRKFLMTVFLFNYNESRVLTTISKGRINIELSVDGKTINTTNEAVVMDRNGKVLAMIPGGTAIAVRLSPEIPADFYDFQKLP
jgi:hypothetical protein